MSQVELWSQKVPPGTQFYSLMDRKPPESEFNEPINIRVGAKHHTDTRFDYDLSLTCGLEKENVSENTVQQPLPLDLSEKFTLITAKKATETLGLRVIET